MPKADSKFRRINGGPQEALRRIDRGAREGLMAQARVVYNAWKRQMALHHGGFKSGDFATGSAVGRITIGPVLALGRFGEYAIQVGTDRLYHLFWELGHMNVFSRKYERVETLRPAVEDTRIEQQAAFTRRFRAAVGD